jgi:hypothetical protein
MGEGEHRRVLDLAAGTGKLTAPLARFGAERWTERDLVTGSTWTPFGEATFRHVHQLSPADVQRMLSVSHVAVLPAGEREACSTTSARCWPSIPTSAAASSCRSPTGWTVC